MIGPGPNGRYAQFVRLGRGPDFLMDSWKVYQEGKPDPIGIAPTRADALLLVNGPLKWSSTPPSTPGWYWAKWERGEPTVQHVCLVDGRLQIDLGPDDFNGGLPVYSPIDNANVRRWAGPIMKPEG